ncbi:MAG: SDR family oxidoreductase [Candidatus Margulisbacteria bacterium]|nr:SDR family oxidoreductase [Candidatus Margulisiibacteriota bacterium]
MKIIITGASGLLGSHLYTFFSSQHSVIGTFHSQEKKALLPLNLCNLSDTQAFISTHKPDVIIHTAALTNVDQCNTDLDLAYQLNVQTVKHLTLALQSYPSTRLIQISTDQVYNKAYSKEEDTFPINGYGITKLLGEYIALQHPNTVVLRTNFYGWGQNKPSFSDWIIKTVTSRQPITLFDDVFFSPLYLSQLSHILDLTISTSLSGVYNAGSQDRVSKKEFAISLANELKLDISYAGTGSAKMANMTAKRPTDMSMDSGKLYNALHLMPYTLQSGLRQLAIDQEVITHATN